MIYNWEKFLESVGEVPISNMDIYNKRMEAGWEDKLFFLRKINPDVIVDFGCADGTILSKIKSINPNIKLIGYETDDKMIAIAKMHLGDDVFLSSRWKSIKSEVNKYKNPAILLSSVIHEVYSYSSEIEVQRFWNSMIFGGDFKWICIRDMIPSININSGDPTFDIKQVRKNSNPNELNSYEEIWGEIKDYKSLLHFLLKYKYVENWNREVKENYFPLMFEELKSIIPNGYNVVFEQQYTLPHLNNQFKTDFGVDIRKNTHLKMIISNMSF